MQEADASLRREIPVDGERLPHGLSELDGDAVAIARVMFAPAMYAELAVLSDTDPDRLWEHCVEHWAPGDRFPSLFFDAEYYAQKIENGEAPPLEADESLFLHWLCKGVPLRVVPTPRFDEAFYYREHLDIANWGAFGFVHFVGDGIREGRRPTAWFDPVFYAHELGAAERTEPAYVHFLTRGIRAGYAASEGLARFLQWRDCAMTAAQYDQLLAASSGWSLDLTPHRLSLLMALFVPESHRPHSGVDDVAELVAYFRHGVASGVAPGPLFDANEYSRRALEAGLALPDAGRPMLLHWLTDGVDERIEPTARFDEAFYQKSYPDIARDALWGYAHFICHGAFEGRSPNAAFPVRRDLQGRMRGMPLCYRTWVREDAVPPPRRAELPPGPDGAALDEWNRQSRLRRSAKTPVVSAIVTAQSGAFAAHCLAAIARAGFPACDAQFIVADDGACDGIADVVARMEGVTRERGERNQSPVWAWNRAAEFARGKYLCFVGDDAEPLPGWLDGLVATAEADDSVGIVGAKLIRSDERLEAAGGIAWRDGTLSRYGRFERADDPQYNVLRDVDYAGSSALLVRAELFRKLGGFSPRFSSADYQSSDLCFGVRSLGYRVVYQPQCEVVVRGALTPQVPEGAKFCEKWAAPLRGHCERGTNVHAAARRINRQHVVLMFDSYGAAVDGGAGSARLTHIARILRQIGYSVVVLAMGYAQPSYARAMQQLGVEVLYRIDGEGGRSWAEAFHDATLAPDLVWVGSPHFFEANEALLRRSFFAKVVYDAPAASETQWVDWQRMNLGCAARADATVVATEGEKQALLAAGASEVFVVPNVSRVAAAVDGDGVESEDDTAWLVELRLRELLGGVRRRAAAKPGGVAK